jgi:hypothetical protein
MTDKENFGSIIDSMAGGTSTVSKNEIRFFQFLFFIFLFFLKNTYAFSFKTLT